MPTPRCGVSGYLSRVQPKSEVGGMMCLIGHTLTPNGNLVSHDQFRALGKERKVSLVCCPVIRNSVESSEPVVYALVLRRVRRRHYGLGRINGMMRLVW